MVSVEEKAGFVCSCFSENCIELQRRELAPQNIATRLDFLASRQLRGCTQRRMRLVVDSLIPTLVIYIKFLQFTRMQSGS